MDFDVHTKHPATRKTVCLFPHGTLIERGLRRLSNLQHETSMGGQGPQRPGENVKFIDFLFA
jgi:hypothetical protein